MVIHVPNTWCDIPPLGREDVNTCEYMLIHVPNTCYDIPPRSREDVNTC